MRPELVGGNSNCNQNQQDQRQKDARRRALGFFHDDRCFNNRFCQRAGKSGRSSSGKGSSKNEFFHFNLQNSRDSR